MRSYQSTEKFIWDTEGLNLKGIEEKSNIIILLIFTVFSMVPNEIGSIVRYLGTGTTQSMQNIAIIFKQD